MNLDLILGHLFAIILIDTVSAKEITKNFVPLRFWQVIAVAKSSDIVLMVLDASKVSMYFTCRP